MTTEITASRKSRRGIKHRSHRMNPKSLENIIPHQYPPGVNGNPKPGNSLKAVLMNELTQELRVKIAKSTIEGAIKREPTPFRELWDRVEGKLQDKEQIRDVNVVFVIGKGYQEQLTEGKDADGTS